MNMEKEKLVSLVTAAKNGDNDALSELYISFNEDIYYYILKTVNDEELALDLTQDAFVEIIKSINSLEEPAAFVTWAKRIAYHKCTDHFKKKSEIIVDEDEDGNTVFDNLKEENGEFIPDEALDKDDFKKTVLSIINSLPEEQRAAVMMYYFDEMSVREIAEIQGLSEGTVKSRLNYARKSIKGAVEEYEKKNGIKLHAIPFFPLFDWLFKGAFEGALPAAKAAALAEGVSAATGVTVTATTATEVAAAVATAATASITAKIAALPIAAKVISGIVAAAIVIGAPAAVILGSKDKDKDPSESKPSISAPANTSSDDKDANEQVGEHEHNWGEWTLEEKEFGAITISRRNERSCSICSETEKAQPYDRQWNYETVIFGEEWNGCIDRYFDVAAGYNPHAIENKFDIDGLFAAGDFLASEPYYEEGSVEISADKYYENLKEYFVLSDDIINEMKSKRPRDTYTCEFVYNGSHLMLGNCVYNGGNKYTVYYTYGGSHATHMPIFKGVVEYKEGEKNKISALYTDGVVFYDMSRAKSGAISAETLIKNVSNVLGTTSWFELSNAETAAAVSDMYAFFDAMDYFGYGLTEEEMYGKGWGGVDCNDTEDGKLSITASWNLPISWENEYGTEQVVLARRDIEKFAKLAGESNLMLSTGGESTKGIDSLTDEMIKEVAKDWFGEKQICISTEKPIVVGGKEYHFSYVIRGSTSLQENAYDISFSITF